ncbi:MAG: IPT/TIG domain-containing protein [Actinobacteria bacterium]|nr:IPT/TIG domain-containing protein [Actinomycetota bacterium]
MNRNLLRLLAGLFFVAVMNVGIVMAVGAPDIRGTILAAQYGDTILPNVTITSPTGTTSADITITAIYDDVDSGINQSSVSVDLDGTVLNGCSVNPDSVSCAVSGLSEGLHQITVHVQDNAGNQRNVGTSFTVAVACAKPVLSLSHSAYWGSYADYSARLLSVSFSVANTGSGNAHNMIVTGGTASSGVQLAGGIPASYPGSSIAPGASLGFGASYIVPTGVAVFSAGINVSAEDDCGNSHTYP